MCFVLGLLEYVCIPTTKVVVPGKAHLAADLLQPYKAHLYPDDLLDGETMGERRLRLRQNDTKSST